MTFQEMQEAHAALSAELDAHGAQLAALRGETASLAGWIATLVRLLMDAGVVSRVTGPFAGLFADDRLPCPFCGGVH